MTVIRCSLAAVLILLTLTTLRSASDDRNPSDAVNAPLAEASVYDPALLSTPQPSSPALGERTLLTIPDALGTATPQSTPPTAVVPQPDAAATATLAAASDPAATATIAPCSVDACTTPTPDSTVEPAAPVDSQLEVRDMIDSDTRTLLYQRANTTWEALQDAFFDEDMQQYRERENGEGWPPYAYLWPLSQVVAAGNDLTQVPQVGTTPAERTGTLLELLALTERYFDSEAEPAGYSSYLLPPYGSGGDRYYDDNVWLGLELVRAYELTGHPVALERATEVLTFMLSGWDTDPAHYAMGGIAWIENENNGNRNTVSTAPAIELALRLYTYAEDDDLRELYWSWATRMYGWMNANLRDDNGMYWDHVRADGVIDTTLHSYNQGAMIGANVMLYRVSGEQQYLDRAIRLANVSADWFRNGGRDDQPIAFNALYFRRLLLLNDLHPTQAWIDLVLDEADLLWETARDSRSGLMTTSSPLTLLDQAAAVQIYGMLAGYGMSPLDDNHARVQ